MDLKNITLTLNGLGEISLDLSIAGVGDAIVAIIHGDQTGLSEADTLRLALKSARITYKDQGLLSRFYETMAALQGLTPDQVRAGFVAEAAGYAQILRDPALVRDFDRSLRSFAANPKSLEIRLDPSEPISLALMAALVQSAPDELARALVPSIAVNQ